jgi:hypothetical protein
MARNAKNNNVCIHWVVVRDDYSGKVVNAHSFTDYKEAMLCKNELDEAPDSEGHSSTVKIEQYIPPDSPYKH